MSRVKFNVNTEYAYLQNFKILQNCFAKHQVDRLVPVESLIKCKMQDNLEFLQWTKRFWDQYFPGGEYDAVARRKGAGAPPTSAASAPVTSSRTSGAGAAARRGAGTPTTTGAAAAPARSIGAGSGAGGGAATAALKQELNTMKETVTGLERERDFYFSKLRDIELLLQQACDDNPELEKEENGLIKQVQTILYSTEEGFEIPADDGVVDDQETF
ncbi:MAG: hypothetical protein Q9168_001991 [Polycauliona sp. 1 TL-2023]